MHYHVEANALNCLIKWRYQTYSGDTFYITGHRKMSLADYYWDIRFSITNFYTSTSLKQNALILRGVLTRNIL